MLGWASPKSSVAWMEDSGYDNSEFRINKALKRANLQTRKVLNSLDQIVKEAEQFELELEQD